MSPAERLLADALMSHSTEPTGLARKGSVVVTWDRVARRYDVGTNAQNIATGPRSRVLPYLTAILAGCVTREACEAWIHRDEEVTT